MTNEISKTISDKYFLNYRIKPSSFHSDKFFVDPQHVSTLHRSEIVPELIHFLTGKGNFSLYLYNIKKKNLLYVIPASLTQALHHMQYSIVLLPQLQERILF